MGKFYEGVYTRVSPYVLALAWWHAVPTQPKGATIAASRMRSRMQLMTDINRAIELPPLDHDVRFIVEMLFEAGPVSTSGEGTVPITWIDLSAWQQSLGVSLPLWQLRLLRKLSTDYLIQNRAAVDPDTPQPWKKDAETLDRAKIAKTVRGILRS